MAHTWTHYLFPNSTNEEFIQGGIYVSSTEFNNSLTILGTEENNQTMIHCVFFITNGPRHDTPVATLTVWGKVRPEDVFTYRGTNW